MPLAKRSLLMHNTIHDMFQHPDCEGLTASAADPAEDHDVGDEVGGEGGRGGGGGGGGGVNMQACV
eukprot:3609232-Pyramimonas_sp.AAC.1